MLNSVMLVAAVLAAQGASTTLDISQKELQARYEQVTPAICVVSYAYEVTNPNSNERTRQNSTALGLIVTSDGLVMTRGHMALENVVPFNIRVAVGRNEQERQYDAVLLRKPQGVNVALLRLQSAEPLNLPHVRFVKTPSLELGEQVVVFGVLGMTLDYTPALLVRRVGAILDAPRTTYCLDDPVPVGYVGGPVLNRQGEVVGVIGYDLATAEGGDLYVRSGHPLIFQADLFARYIESPPGAESEAGEEGAWLGVFTQPLTDDLAEYWGLEKRGGAVVSTVMPGSPASEAGVLRGDVIVEFNGNPVRAKQDREVFSFTRMIRETGIGKAVPVRVLRDGKPVDLTVTLAAQPKAARDASEFEEKVFGLTVRELTTDVRIMLNLPVDVKGVIVRTVQSGSWAALANIRPGVIILAFGGHPVTNLKDFEEAVAKVTADKPAEVPVFARVGPMTGFFRIEPRWPAEAK